jgi:hypothetical protein
MLGYESAVVNGQLVNVAPAPAYDPLIFGAAYTGPAWPRQGVYNVPPVMPSASAMTDMAPGAYGGTGTAVIPTATSETGNPFHIKKSPVLWAIFFLIASLLMLHYVHFK